MKIFIINLKRDLERKAAMQKQLDQFDIDYEFIEAIDGNQLDDLELDFQCSIEDSKLTNGEIGCYLSHLMIWNRIVDEKIERACILEDDIILKPEFVTVLAEITKLSENTIYYLQGDFLGESSSLLATKRKKFFSIINLNSCNYKFGIFTWPSYGTLGYVMGLQVAKLLLSSADKVKIPIDDYLLSNWIHKVPILELHPPILRLSNIISNLEEERKAIHLTRDNSFTRILKKLSYLLWVFRCYGTIAFIKICCATLKYKIYTKKIDC